MKYRYGEVSVAQESVKGRLRHPDTTALRRAGRPLCEDCQRGGSRVAARLAPDALGYVQMSGCSESLLISRRFVPIPLLE
jgi:hypothetical protein